MARDPRTKSEETNHREYTASNGVVHTLRETQEGDMMASVRGPVPVDPNKFPWAACRDGVASLFHPTWEDAQKDMRDRIREL